MGERFDRVYRMAARTVLGPPYFNAVFRDLDDRLAPLEDKRTDEETVYRSIEDRVLVRSEAVIEGLRARLVEITSLAWLTALSDTPATLAEGQAVSLSIVESNRALFAPGPFSVVARIGDPDAYAVVRTVAYGRDLGQYDFEVVTAHGDLAGRADWTIGAVAGSTLAQLQLLAQGKVIRDALLVARQNALDAAGAAAGSAAAAAGSATTASTKAAFADTRAGNANDSASAALASEKRAAAYAGTVDGSLFTARDGSRPFTGRQAFAAGEASGASLAIPPGTDPSAPSAGDLWNVGGTLKAFLGGVTRVFAFLGIAQTWTARQSFNGAANLVPGAVATAPANGDLTADATGLPIARVAGAYQPLATAADAAANADAIARRMFYGHIRGLR